MGVSRRLSGLLFIRYNKHTWTLVGTASGSDGSSVPLLPATSRTPPEPVVSSPPKYVAVSSRTTRYALPFVASLQRSYQDEFHVTGSETV